jgi:hypothetical protein
MSTLPQDLTRLQAAADDDIVTEVRTGGGGECMLAGTATECAPA